ncbi:sigma-70 family RNA polymerase sigma factor [bacterium]|nr:sigma-70 family RNA polymerase sigma factor [bacterium]
MTPTEDRDLIRRALKGDQRAFEALYRAHRPRVYAVVVRRAEDRDETEDLIQVTFIRAFQALRGFRGDAAFSTWLTQIALNVCASHLRAQQVRQGYEAANAEALRCAERASACDESPEAAIYGRWRREAVRQGIQTLPPRYREAVYLRYVQDRSYREITRALQVPMGTVKTWLCRARRQLQGEFRKSGLLAA